jgi:hypothetical protein
MRMLALFFLAVVAMAAEYAPQLDAVRLYAWNTTQTAQWKSAGDELRYATDITWQLALRCAALDGPRLTLNATFISVHATHRGPGTDITIDSATGAGSDDPLLGHLVALAGATLSLDVERSTGHVVAVRGGEAIIAAINTRAPPAVVGDPPPLDAQAQAAFGPDALARLWSQILALPGSDAAVVLPAPFTTGGMQRNWKDQAWTAALPAGTTPAFELSKDPQPVRGTLRKLTGGGSIELDAGLPSKAAGHLEFTLAIEAQTQPVETVNVLGWTLERH